MGWLHDCSGDTKDNICYHGQNITRGEICPACEMYAKIQDYVKNNPEKEKKEKTGYAEYTLFTAKGDTIVLSLPESKYKVGDYAKESFCDNQYEEYPTYRKISGQVIKVASEIKEVIILPESWKEEVENSNIFTVGIKYEGEENGEQK